MATSKERLTVFENIIARVGLDGDVLGEYAKAMSTLNGLQTQMEMNPPMPPQPQIGTSAPLSPQNGTMSPLGDQGFPMGLNQPV